MWDYSRLYSSKSIKEKIVKKTILITSGAKRFGRAIAEAILKDNWSIALHYNSSKIEAEETAHFLTEKGGEIYLYQADFLDIEKTEKLIESVAKDRVNWCGLINNAGLFSYDTGDNYSFKNLDKHMRVNFSAPALLTKGLYKNIRKVNAKNYDSNIAINILDGKIFGLNPDYYSYTLSKLSSYGLVKMAALSYAPFLRVNGVAPGITLPAKGQTLEQFKKAHKKNILEKSSTIKEVIAAVKFLINSPSVTGHVSLLDGGAHLSPPKRDVAIEL